MCATVDQLGSEVCACGGVTCLHRGRICEQGRGMLVGGHGAQGHVMFTWRHGMLAHMHGATLVGGAMAGGQEVSVLSRF